MRSRRFVIDFLLKQNYMKNFILFFIIRIINMQSKEFQDTAIRWRIMSKTVAYFNAQV